MTPDHTERDAAVARVMAKMRAKKAQRVGADFEQQVRLRLIGLGFEEVERVATPMFSLKIRGERKHFHARKVSGDIKAIDPRSGRAVLVECKCYQDGLPFKALAPHQVANLDRTVLHKGIAILAWGSSELVLLDWAQLRVAGFKRGTSLTEAMVAAAVYRHR